MGWGCKHYSLSKVVITFYHSPQNKTATKLNLCLFCGGGAYLYNQKGGLMCKAGKQCVSIGGGESLWILPLFILIMYPYACF